MRVIHDIQNVQRNYLVHLLFLFLKKNKLILKTIYTDAVYSMLFELYKSNIYNIDQAELRKVDDCDLFLEEKKGNDDDAEEPGAQKIKSSICELDAHKSKELKKKGIDLAKLGGISDAI